MPHYSVIKYEASKKKEWDDFIASPPDRRAGAKNATFLFYRDFMEYHADRFADFSLMIYKDGKLVGLLPANRKNDTVFSHQGLTYGGLILLAKAKMKEVLGIFKGILIFLTEHQIKKLVIKPVPTFYNILPAEEMEYLLFLASAKTECAEVASVIDFDNRLPIQKNRLEGLKKAEKHQLKIIETADFSAFWNEILVPNLTKKHGASPVHTLEEIKQLAQNFPNNIRQFVVVDHNQKTVAGTTIFETQQVAHVQYISGDENKQQLGSLDFLFHHLIENVFADKKYFDFGTSNEKAGQHLNGGLNYWKESFGARSLVYKRFSLKTENHRLLDNVLL